MILEHIVRYTRMARWVPRVKPEGTILPRKRETRMDVSKRKSHTMEERDRVYFAEAGDPYRWVKRYSTIREKK